MVGVKHHNLLISSVVCVSKRHMEHFTVSKKFAMRKSVLLSPKYPIIFKSKEKLTYLFLYCSFFHTVPPV